MCLEESLSSDCPQVEHYSATKKQFIEMETKEQNSQISLLDQEELYLLSLVHLSPENEEDQETIKLLKENARRCNAPWIEFLRTGSAYINELVREGSLTIID